MIAKTTFNFLNQLQQNNNREWFQDNRSQYEQSKENFIEYCANVLKELCLFHPEMANTQVKDCIFRINRDVRFSANKAPYKNNFSAAFGPGGRKSGKIDYYLQIQPNNESILGGGLWQPSPENLAKFRQEIDYNPEVLKKIINNKTFQKSFPIIHGERLKNVPKGYPADHVDAELLKYKEMFYIKKYNDVEFVSSDSIIGLIIDCKTLKPYLDYINTLFEI